MAMKRYTSVDQCFERAEHFKAEMLKLRGILNSMDLDECLKWSFPCYTHNGQNVVGIGSFGSYFGLWFFQGALLKDEHEVLVNAQEGKTKAMRQWRMKSAKEIKVRQIKSYVKEAIELARQGKSIKADRSKAVIVTPQLKQALSQNKRAKTAFDRLTKGKQREYADYIADAKRDETKVRRLEKIMPMIAGGLGLNDKYR